MDWEWSKISALLGKTLAHVEVVDNEVIFTTDKGVKYKLYHEQDCCESVTVDDIVGDLTDLVGAPILLAEETSKVGDLKYGDTYTWTFYKLATIKGYVTIKFYGTSNGYYSERVSFEIVSEGE